MKLLTKSKAKNLVGKTIKWFCFEHNNKSSFSGECTISVILGERLYTDNGNFDKVHCEICPTSNVSVFHYSSQTQSIFYQVIN
tara:strand:+ start:1266 stop:1514 length:249 start_codon:yes stop_codon:yes gene_type:complete